MIGVDIACPDNWENPITTVIVAGVGQIEKAYTLARHLHLTGYVVVALSEVEIQEQFPRPRLELIELSMIEKYSVDADVPPYKTSHVYGFPERGKNIPQKRLKLFQWHYQCKKRREYRPQ